MRNILSFLFLALAIILTTSTAQAQSTKVPNYLKDSVAAALRRVTLREVAGSYVKVESIKLVGEDDKSDDDTSDENAKPVMEIRASVELAYYPMRNETIEHLYEVVREELPKEFKEYELKLFADGCAVGCLDYVR